MNMLFPTLVLPIILMIALTVLLVYRRRSYPKTVSITHSLQIFKINLILLAICLAIAAVTAYMITANLADSGYPNKPEDVQTAEQVLEYLQQSNRAVMTNVRTIVWFFYVFTLWFLTALYSFSRAIVRALLAYSRP